MGQNRDVLQDALGGAEVSDDMKSEVPPPRYEMRGNWKHLICDEQEWLARPAPWGIDILPEEVRYEKTRIKIHS